MFLSRQKSGVWSIIYFNESGKRTKKTTKTKNEKEAKSVLEKFKKEYLNSDFNMTFENLVKNFLDVRSNSYSRNNIENYKSTVKEFNMFIKNKIINTLTQRDINNYFIYLNKKDKPSSVNIKMIRLSVLFRFALDSEFINKSFVFERIKVHQKEKEFLSFQEYNKILQNCKNIDLQDIIDITVNTGLRISEATSLQWEDVDFDNRILIIGRSFITKTKKIRDVPLNDSSYNILLKRFYIKTNDFIFTHKGERWSNSTLQIAFKKLVKNLIPYKSLSFHNLRHSFASNMIKAGCDVIEVAKLLGHENVASTMVYTHIPTNALRHCVDSIDKKQINIKKKINEKVIPLVVNNADEKVS